MGQKTKWFRVATSGKTIDGREITPAQIDQMAAAYKPETYGARIWMEHLRSFLPDSQFRAYGDVLALKAEAVEDGKRGLFAQIDATPDLMKLSADRQKVFWSIEMDPAFAGTGQAYMVGLAVTDSPASLSTEMLKFSLQAANAPADVKGHLFSEQVEGKLQPEESPDDKPTIFARVKELLSGQTKADGTRFSALEQSVTAIAEEVAGIKTAIAGFSAGAGKPDAQLSGKVDQLSTDFTELKTALSKTSPTLFRPKSDGNGSAATATDC